MSRNRRPMVGLVVPISGTEHQSRERVRVAKEKHEIALDRMRQVSGLRDAVIRKAGLFMDLWRGEDTTEGNDDDAREELFAAIDALREATK